MTIRQAPHEPTDDGAYSASAELERGINALMTEGGHDLTQTALEWLTGRFLGEVRWFERKAELTKRWHYILRIIAISGGVLVPAMIAFAGSNQGKGWNSLRVAASLMGVVVALAIGLDGFFQWGERWMRYRQTAELLKMEGWSYLEGLGRYRRDEHQGPASNFSAFATHVEGAIHQDVAAFLTTIASEHRADDSPPTKGRSAHSTPP